MCFGKDFYLVFTFIKNFQQVVWCISCNCELWLCGPYYFVCIFCVWGWSCQVVYFSLLWCTIFCYHFVAKFVSRTVLRQYNIPCFMTMTSLLLIACGRIPVIAFIVIFWCRRFVVIWRYIFDRKPTLFCSRPIFHAWMYFVNIEIVIFCIFTSPLSGPFKSVSFGH